MHPGMHVATTPDKTAVVMVGSGEVLTYRELDERAQRLAQLWWSWGLRPGDHVAIMAENHPRYYEVYWAAMRSGLYITAVNRHFSAEEAAYVLGDSCAQVLVTTAALAGVAAEIPALLTDPPRLLMMDGTVDGFEPYEAAVAAMPAEPLAAQPRGDIMLYSSGTTGRPKGIKRPLSGRSVDEVGGWGIAPLERSFLGMGADSVYLSPAPLYHAAPLAWSAAVHELGGTVVVMERFDAEDFLRAVERHRVTHSQVVPTMLIRLLKLPDDVRAGYDVSSLRGIVHAAAPCPVDVKRQIIDWLGPIVYEYYAGTEGNGITLIDTEQWLAHPGSVGRPVNAVAHICADDGEELPPGETGLIYFERPEPSFEYHGDPEKTRAAQHPDHPLWTALGDVGYLDDEGYLYLTDRKSFMIISGGVNIYPQEIEDCLIMHPRVADVAVFGLPDPEMGEYVQAVVQPAAGVAPGEALAEELRAFTRARIAHFKVPRAFDFRPELPRMPTGKLAKHLLRAEYLPAREP